MLYYVNHGGYPEAPFSPAIRGNPAQYIKSDIIDKVLLRDRPILYGIQDLQALNRLFTLLAYNSGGEGSLERLAVSSGVAKNTLKRYLAYLEAAFLIRRVERIDPNAQRFKRAMTFKVYLTNPSMRAAEIKWTDKPYHRREDLDGCVQFCRNVSLRPGPMVVTSRTILDKDVTYRGVQFEFQPASLHAYGLGERLFSDWQAGGPWG